MARVVISHLAPAQEHEIQFLCDLAYAFERRGHQPIIWSGIYDQRFAPYYLPLNWRLNRLPNFYQDLSVGIDATFREIDRDKWAIRVDQLIKQEWTEPDRSAILNYIASMSYQMVEQIQPDLLLSWNTLCPHTGIAHDLCRARGIPAYLIERAVFPETWFIEPGGLIGLSTLAGVSLSSLMDEPTRAQYRWAGKQYLDKTSFAGYNRYAQRQDSKEMERLLQGEGSRQRPRVVFFPPDDGTLGFVPVKEAVTRETGRTFPINDHLTAANHIKSFLEDPQLLQAMGKQGRQRVLSHYSQKSQAAGITRIFKALEQQTEHAL